jgi:hypothetical protein
MSAAQGALDSLLGMGINYCPTGHNPREKVGFIHAAHIVANEIKIDGFIYSSDFPEIAVEIKANKHNLGLSFEARDLMTTNPDADPIPIAECVFTGAAILLRDKAAYKTTFIHANKETEMSSIIDKMSATDRAKLADSLVAAAPHMNETELRDTIATLTQAFHTSDSIKAAKAKAHSLSIMHKIAAARDDAPRSMTTVDGALRRANLPAFEEISLKPQHEISAILASEQKKSKNHERGAMSKYERDVVREALHRVGALG